MESEQSTYIDYRDSAKTDKTAVNEEGVPLINKLLVGGIGSLWIAVAVLAVLFLIYIIYNSLIKEKFAGYTVLSDAAHDNALEDEIEALKQIQQKNLGILV